MEREERMISALRSLYEKYGYTPYRMSKFEEYDFYLKNKEFLKSDRVLAFADTDGKMMALKPDVTLSIIKSGEDVKGAVQKVYYNENVYRVSESSRRFREIMQSGVECIGDVGLYDIYEVVNLAAESLAAVSERFVLAVSHLGVVDSVIKSASGDPLFRDAALKCVSEKNVHDLKTLCGRYGVSKIGVKAVETLITAYGDRKAVLKALSGVADKNCLDELKAVSDLLDSSPYSDRVQFDFSLVEKSGYYNGLLFKGFVEGVSGEVLSGGQYDGMMKKMERDSRAIGFAVYLDLLEKIAGDRKSPCVDVLVLYDDKTDVKDLAAAVSEMTAEGKTVRVGKTVPENLGFGATVSLKKD